MRCRERSVIRDCFFRAFPLQFCIDQSSALTPKKYALQHCFWQRVGERGRNRTFNLLIKSQLLCQSSYAPTMSWKGLPQEGTTIITNHSAALRALATALKAA